MDYQKQNALESVSDLYGRIEFLAKKSQHYDRLFDLLILVFTACTTGSLWLLVTAKVPVGAAWLGAILSTLATILTAAKKIYGLSEKHLKAAGLYRRTGELLAELRSDHSPNETFWYKFKSIESDLL